MWLQSSLSKCCCCSLCNIIAKIAISKQSFSGREMLTKERALKIQNYYGHAIKDNVHDPALPKKRIFAILFHLTPTDSNPRHAHCPPGEKSWCFLFLADSHYQAGEPRVARIAWNYCRRCW